MPDAVAVLDLGKTNLKLVLIDPAGAVIAVSRADNRPRPGPPYPHADVDHVWRWLLDSLRAAAARHRIAAIVPAAYGSTAALVSRDELVLPVLDYEAEPPDAVKRAYAVIAPPFAEVFAPINPGGLTLGRQLFWQEQAFPDAFARARHILTYAQYWAWRLTGVAAAEATSLGAQTQLWNPVARDYSSLAKARGWTARMPPLKPAWTTLGTITPAVAVDTGLPPATPVLCGIHDSNANYLRYLAAGFTDFTLMSTGTWLINFNAAQDPSGLDPARDTNTNSDVEGRPVACSRFMVGREFDLLAGDGRTVAATAGDLEPAIAAGTMALPSFSDSGGPCPGTGGRGRIVGTRPGTPRARAALATLYCALMSCEALDAVGSTNDLIIDGGFVANALYGQLIAALRPGQRVRVSAEREGTALGAALLHGWAERRQSATLALRDVAPAALSGLPAYAARWQELARQGG